MGLNTVFHGVYGRLKCRQLTPTKGREAASGSTKGKKRTSGLARGPITVCKPRPDPKTDLVQNTEPLTGSKWSVHVRLFVANENKPHEIVTILVTNRSKLLRLLAAFVHPDDEVFETDKSQVINELAVLELED
nr:putative MO25-like protein At5g47540 [Tanacetum cinerariifolium]